METLTTDALIPRMAQRRQGKEIFSRNSYPSGHCFVTFDYGDKNGACQQDYWEDVPDRRENKYDRRRSAAYLEGFATGLTWDNDWRPGGPATSYYREGDSEEWRQRCNESQKANEDYLRGFDAGIEERDRLKVEE